MTTTNTSYNLEFIGGLATTSKTSYNLEVIGGLATSDTLDILSYHTFKVM